jgi:hypothetical protein
MNRTALIVFIKRVFRLRPPRWDYRNPACRTCTRCGINQHLWLYHNGAEVWEANCGYDEPCSCARNLGEPGKGYAARAALENQS